MKRFWYSGILALGLLAGSFGVARALNIFAVPQGGTGAGTLSSGGVLMGNGTGPITSSSSPSVGTLYATTTLKVQNWEVATSTVVCIAPERCQFQATGTNDNITLQRAVYYVASSTYGKGTVYVKNGTYNLTNTWTGFTPVPADSYFNVLDGVNLVGESREGTILKGTGIEARGSQDIRNLTINVNGHGTDDGIASWGSNKTFDNIHIRDFTNKGIELVGTTADGGPKNIYIDHCYIETTYHTGGGSILLGGPYRNIHVQNCWFGNNNNNGNFFETIIGSFAGGPDNEGLYFQNNEVYGDFGKSSYFVGRHIRIENNYIHSTFQISSGTHNASYQFTTKDVVVSGNSFLGFASTTGESALDIGGTSTEDSGLLEDVHVDNNIFDSSHITFGYGTTSVFRNISITKNTFKKSDSANILLLQSSSQPMRFVGLTIKDNEFKSWRNTSGNWAAIQLSTNAAMDFSHTDIIHNDFGPTPSASGTALYLQNQAGAAYTGTIFVDQNNFATTTITEDTTGIMKYGINQFTDDSGNYPIIGKNTLVIDSINSLIGIGTATPNMTLTIRASNASNNWLQFVNNDGTMHWHLSYDSGALNFVESSVAGRLWLQNGGKVGVGTSSPAQLLTVTKDSNGNSAYFAGNVGIGVATATAALELKASSSIYMDGPYRRISDDSNASGGYDFNFYNSLGSNPGGAFNFKLSDTGGVLATLTTNGNFGVGTTSPGTTLGIHGSAVIASSTTASVFYATSTTASSTFGNGINLSNGCFAISGTCLSTSGGSGTNAPNEFTYTVANQGNYLTPTSTAVGLLTVGSSTISNLVSIYATATQATTTYLSVGTLASTSKLTVSNQAGIGATPSTRQLQIGGTKDISFGTSGTNAIYFYDDGANTDSIWIKGGVGINLNSYPSVGNPITFSHNNVEEMRIGSNGYVGIGTTTPGTILSVSGAAVIAGTTTATVYTATSTTGTSTFAGGFTAATSGGIVGIGTTSPWRTLSVSGTVAMSGLTTEAGSSDDAVCIVALTKEIQTNSGATTCLLSARRFKHDINPFSTSIDNLLAFQPVTYKSNGTNIERIGFIADDSPEARLIDHNGHGEVQSFEYQNFTAYIVAGLRDFYAKFQTLVARVTGLEKKVQEQQKQLDHQQQEIDQLKAKIK